jgi:hypothetical protein
MKGQIMQLWQPVSSRGLMVAAAATLLAMTAGLAACGGEDPTTQALIRGVIEIDSISQQGECETVTVKVEPVTISPNPPKLANSKLTFTEVALTKPADAGDAPICRGSVPTIPLAPGVWKFTAPLPSETNTCEREFKAGGNLTIKFKDGEAGCT